jgi:hypothetical protein
VYTKVKAQRQGISKLPYSTSVTTNYTYSLLVALISIEASYNIIE